MAEPKETKSKALYGKRWTPRQRAAIEEAARKAERSAAEVVKRGTLRLVDEILAGKPWPAPTSTEK